MNQIRTGLVAAFVLFLIFKIQKAQIHDIEAMGISLPLHSKNGRSGFWR